MSRPETALYAYQHGWQAAIDLCIAAAIYDYEHAPAKCLYTTKDAADQLYGEYGEEIEVEG